MVGLLLMITFLLVEEKSCEIQKRSVSMSHWKTWVLWLELIIKLNEYLFELLLCSSSSLDIYFLWIIEPGGIKSK